MSDRELLELAAKAAGYEMAHTGENEKVLWLIKPGSTPDPDGERPIFAWNPLTDDGDALRLAVKLNFEIERSKLADRAYVGHVDEAPWVEYVNDEQDIYECTRRAIVRAAAEVGRSMP